MEWRKGPLPPDTWDWGGVVLVGDDPQVGFFFADFCGDHVKIIPGDKVVTADQIAWYNNGLKVPVGVKSRAK